MITLLKCEYEKTRRTYLFLTVLGITLIQLCWAFYGIYREESLKWGWMMFLYQFPLVNSFFLPLLSVVISSRLADLEHKGVMLKYLAVITDKKRIYDAKLIYGLFIVSLCNLISWSATILFGYIVGFSGAVPLRLYLLYLLFTIMPTIVVYQLLHALSLLFQNQAVSFFNGIIGTFIGLFSMFLPQFPILRLVFPWGYYGALQFIGMFGWTKETRMKNVYFSVMEIDWVAFGILILMGIALYLIGEKLFERKEV